MNVSDSNSDVGVIRDVTRALIYFCGIDFNVGEPCNCSGCKLRVEKFKHHGLQPTRNNDEHRP